MGIYIEAIILYILLFFSGSAAVFTGTSSETNELGNLAKIILYIIPSLALIWYLIYKAVKGGTFNTWVISTFKFSGKDLKVIFITLPFLLLIGSLITLAASHINETQMQMTYHLPSTITGWIILCIISILSAYLEESYFRFYLLSKRHEMNLGTLPALFLSVALFSICHIYGGFWFFLNSVIGGTFLGFMFLQFNSLHGIAIAHALYNIFAFITIAFNQV